MAKPAPRPRPRSQAPKSSEYREQPRRLPPVEPLAAVGGRLWWVALMVLLLWLLPYVLPDVFTNLGAGVISVFWPEEGPQTQPTAAQAEWAVGATKPVEITLITADYNKLACAAQEEFEGHHCLFKDEKTPWPRDPSAPRDDNKKNQIQPYRTVKNELIFVSGLWAEPSVAMRLHREPPNSQRENKLARFSAHCQLRFIGQLQAPKTRWAPGGPWLAPAPGESTLVAVPEKCSVK